MKKTHKISGKKRINKAGWLIAVGLILLSIVPMIAGSARIAELASGAEITPENARFFASPLPVIVHIISSILFCIVGAFQFVPGFRHRHLSWHRTAGWLLMSCGIAAALSGLWMTRFYPWPEGDGELLYAMRLVVEAAMLVSIGLSIVAVRRRDFASHGDWIIRGYAIGLGAGTQVLTHLPWFLLMDTSTPGEFPRAMMMGAGWAINIVVAEWIIRKKRARRTRRKRITSATV